LSDRSRMNIPFTLADSKLDGEFLKDAEARGIVQLKGHRAVGGMRALDLQRHADRGGAQAGRIHAGVRGEAGLMLGLLGAPLPEVLADRLRVTFRSFCDQKARRSCLQLWDVRLALVR
jgi:hypothetical protein